MRIYYTEKFSERLNSESSEIDLGLFRLGTLKNSYSNLESINLQYVFSDSGASPGIGYYEYTGILDKKSNKLLLNLCVPNYDLGIINESYGCCYCFYKEYDKIDLGFILLSDTKDDKLGLDSLQNIIEIPNFKASGKINLPISEDIDFLESTVGDISNIYSGEEENMVSIDSWDSWRLENFGTDMNPHVNTVFINKFGIKTY